jgi:hypothetical protein
MAKTVSGKVKKTPPSQVSSGRYDFIELAETEPDLGIPESSGYLLGSNTDGTRGWVNLTTRVAYEYVQGAPSDTWVIAHNLGFKPNVTVVDSAGTIYEGEITYTNTVSLTVTFSSAFSGKAYLS